MTGALALGRVLKAGWGDSKSVRAAPFDISPRVTYNFTVSAYLRSLPGEFTALHLLCIMYVAFKQFAPDTDIGFDLSAEYGMAVEVYRQ